MFLVSLLSSLPWLHNLFQWLLNRRLAFLFGLGVAAILGRWLWRLYKSRISILAGTVKVDDQPLPGFRIKLYQGSVAAYSWVLEQNCEKGFYIVHAVPHGEIMAEFTWGQAASCQVTAKINIEKGTNLFDLDVDLAIEEFVVAAGSRDTATDKAAKVTWRFKTPKSHPTPVTFNVDNIKFSYGVSHVDNAREYAEKSAEWTGPRAAPDQWAAEAGTEPYRHSGGAEKWSVVVAIDGFPGIKRTARFNR